MEPRKQINYVGVSCDGCHTRPRMLVEVGTALDAPPDDLGNAWLCVPCLRLALAAGEKWEREL